MGKSVENRRSRHVNITGTQQIHVEELCILYGNARCYLRRAISIYVISKAKWWIISEEERT